MKRLALFALATMACATGGRVYPNMKLNDAAEALVQTAESIKDGDTLPVVQQKTVQLGQPTSQSEAFCNRAGCVDPCAAGDGNIKHVSWVRENVPGKPPLILSVDLKRCISLVPLRNDWYARSVDVFVASGKTDTWGNTVPPARLYHDFYVYAGCED